MRSEPSTRSATRAPATAGPLLVGGSGIAALAAGVASAACCVLPLALTVAGLGGAWLANLAVLVWLEPFLIGIAGLSLAAAWWWIARQWLRPALGPDCTACRRPVWPLLALATAATAIALARPAWEGPALRALWAFWIGR